MINQPSQGGGVYQPGAQPEHRQEHVKSGCFSFARRKVKRKMPHSPEERKLQMHDDPANSRHQVKMPGISSITEMLQCLGLLKKQPEEQGSQPEVFPLPPPHDKKKVCQWSKLPDEMVLKILKYLPAQDLGRCAIVDRRISAIATEILLSRPWKLNLKRMHSIPHQKNVFAASLSPDGHSLMTKADDDIVRMFTLKGGVYQNKQPFTTPESRPFRIGSTGFSNNGLYAGYASVYQVAILARENTTETAKWQPVYTGKTEHSHTLRFSPNNRTASFCDNASLKFLEIKDKGVWQLAPKKTLSYPEPFLTFEQRYSADGHTLAVSVEQ